MYEVIGDKYMYLTYYVHLVGTKRSDWLQKCTEWKVSKYTTSRSTNLQISTEVVCVV